ncbi:MAG: sensor histidine kinase [Planctomycetota bacterium]
MGDVSAGPDGPASGTRVGEAQQPRSKTLRRLAMPNPGAPLLVQVTVLVGLVLTRLHTYLLFHSLVEVFSIVVAFGIFTVFWNARRFLDNGAFLFLGIAYLFVGLVDLLHALAYEQMNVFQHRGANLATQLWVCGRFIQSASLLAAPLLIRRHFQPRFVLAAYTLVVGLLLSCVFWWRVFPECFSEKEGLTLFKITSEYAVCVVLVASLVLLYRRRDELDRRVFTLFAASILLTIGSEVAFTFYSSVTGPSNMVGHLLKLVAFYLIYVAFIEVGLTNPYAVLFRNLKASERQLELVNETLERRVAERTSEAEHRAAQLRVLASELTLAEQRERRRLAQTLHDHFQQLLVAAKLKMGLLLRRTEEEGSRRLLRQLGELLDDLINASRSLTVKLSPPILDHAGLSAALEWLAQQMEENHGLRVTLDAQTDAEPQSEEIRILVFQAVRELLFNVVKHARVDGASVTVTQPTDQQLCVVVTDSGAGFDASELETTSTFEGGFGLFSVRERIRLMGGRVDVHAAPGKGTRVSIVAPLVGPPPRWHAAGQNAATQAAASQVVDVDSRGPEL